MFKTKRAKAENIAAIPSGIPRPPQTIINNHASEAAVILAKGLLILILAPVLWWFLLYVVEEMGYRNPVRTVGFTFFGLLILLAVSYAIHLSGTHFFRMWTDYNLAALEIKAEIARHHALTAAQPRPGESRLTGEDSKFAALLRIVMDEAYRHIYRNPNQVQQYGNRAKPWTRRACKGLEIPGFDKPVTEEMAGKVSTWLEEKGVIDDKGNINISEGGYPSFAKFEALLEREFYTPIQVQKALSPVLSQGGFEFIKQ